MVEDEPAKPTLCVQIGRLNCPVDIRAPKWDRPPPLFRGPMAGVGGRTRATVQRATRGAAARARATVQPCNHIPMQPCNHATLNFPKSIDFPPNIGYTQS